MQKIYCSKCSNPTEFSDTKPRFCGFCSNPFAGTVISSIKIEPIPESRPQQRKIIAHRQVEEQYEDTENEDNEYINTNFEPPEIEFDNLPSRPTIKGKDLALDTSPKEKIFREKNKLKLPKNKKQAEIQLDQELRNEFSKGGKRNSTEIGGM